jgi:hypothetical protein
MAEKTFQANAEVWQALAQRKGLFRIPQGNRHRDHGHPACKAERDAATSGLLHRPLTVIACEAISFCRLGDCASRCERLSLCSFAMTTLQQP